MRHRGLAYPFPFAYLLLDAFNDAFDSAWFHVYYWNETRGANHGIPSIFG